jgi:transposase
MNQQPNDKGLWRAGCGGTRTSGSEVRAGETDHRKRRHRAPARPYTFAWLGRYRRLSKDYEFLTATSEAVIYLSLDVGR